MRPAKCSSFFKQRVASRHETGSTERFCFHYRQDFFSENVKATTTAMANMVLNLLDNVSDYILTQGVVHIPLDYLLKGQTFPMTSTIPRIATNKRVMKPHACGSFIRQVCITVNLAVRVGCVRPRSGIVCGGVVDCSPGGSRSHN